MVLGSLQPSYLSWIPSYKRMQVSDIFVFLDDVEFSKNSFHNRNRIKTPQGSLNLTVPILYKGHSKTFLKDMPINNNIRWTVKHWRTIEQNYSKAKYFDKLGTLLWEKIYKNEWEKLADLNIRLIEIFRDFLGIEVKCYRSSKLGIKGQGNEKLINICRKLGAKKFVVKPNTEHYHPKEIFNKHEIGFEYFSFKSERYPQLYGGFISGLSILDYAMNCGPRSFH